MTLHSTELTAVAERFRIALAAAVADPPTALSGAQRAQLGRQARVIENALAGLDWELNRSWLPIQEAFAAALAPPAPRALVVDRAAYRRKTRRRTRRNR